MLVSDWAVIGLLAAIALVDLLLVVLKYPTISNRLRTYGRLWATCPFVWGVLGGHFWGPSGLEPVGGSWWISIGLLFAACAGAGALHRLLERLDQPDWVVLLYVPAGLPAGALLWPQ